MALRSLPKKIFATSLAKPGPEQARDPGSKIGTSGLRRNGVVEKAVRSPCIALAHHPAEEMARDQPMAATALGEMGLISELANPRHPDHGRSAVA